MFFPRLGKTSWGNMSLLMPGDEKEIAELLRQREKPKQSSKGKEAWPVQDTAGNSVQLQHCVRDGERWQGTEQRSGPNVFPFPWW